ncbi:S-formylglutathione hydrolase [Oleiphilus sp. HI0071]|uniref:S-formylglutathione hydrolase n=4 Tax=unclassified Oleiphilus TaxID=2631174 RepID=UPI0007C39CA2|nr:S-formylglutathione hydrolase [Oleiphilus sp. HI0079]KZY72483.1 S-formylglutathione hydrolase [Oleiphilus sp. HI0065]KZY83676.1 S-formylglutathione hydrolase [Oleiphilus sp. HI0071]KZZ04753.1 S-formylglutathione hydrolase [Oleiphilus sp. HI0073]KZZ44934.1 S-formylglutathione hydrolase [Oleiphilus sp. HI0118]KZZ52674.1 S-formylglutathione hydrolase [Oleiphilus sp. HI0122]KZZ70015.1 S-formylglutathione hydrolase [Oleiphilus sp. HI0130]KZZ81091.1 S-formylglutathione hydrolase [Oleiphilus sp.
MELLSQQSSFEGRYVRYRHASAVNHCDMIFSVFVPPCALKNEEALKNTPVVYWLSGLTCTDENFMQKAGAHRIASDLGLILVAPDTSPRGEDVPDDADKSYDFGHGAGFYVNATQAPWNQHYHMYDYIVYELPELLSGQLGMQGNAAIMGHSMGGHGALTIGLRHPDLYRSISAFSPICHPVESPWGQKAFSGYLGDDTEAWAEHDATLLLERVESHLPILVDQGSEDQFLKEQLGTTQLQAALKRNKGYSQVNMRETYDHSYFFIASFIEEHLRFHAEHLK